mmetsp:Transcript_57624/g.134891  ORF Transcript_57624/g.134891 Transcript_57624/m.134891 type:complete len:214 (-) Transcript_57624:19-660(-)
MMLCFGLTLATLAAVLPYASAGVDLVDIASQEARRDCVHWQQAGCLLDVFEKTCDDGGASSAWPFLDKHKEESVWLCCCPLPYKPCKRSAQVDACVDSMAVHIQPVFEQGKREGNAPQLRKAIQAVRADLIAKGGEQCSVLADGSEHTTCGSEAHPRLTRSIARADLFCEMLTWQREELGDGDAGEFKRNGCPWPKKKAKHGDARKGGRMLEL